MTDNDIFAAELRVKEMERMARQYVEQSNRAMNIQSRGGQQRPRFEPMPQRSIPAAGNAAAGLPPPPPEPEPPAPSVPAARKGEFMFNIDGEKMLIILIIVLLLKEKADIKLIAALGYLLL